MTTEYGSNASMISRVAVVVNVVNRGRDGESATPEPWSRSRGPPGEAGAVVVAMSLRSRHRGPRRDAGVFSKKLALC